MLITLRLGKNHEPGTFPFQCRGAIRSFCLHRFRNHPAQQCARSSPLWFVLLRHVRRRSFTGGLADVAFAPVVVRFYFLRPSEYYNLETSVVKTNFTLSKNALSILPC